MPDHLHQCGAVAIPKGLYIHQRQHETCNAAAQGKPPGAHTIIISQLRRTNGRRAAHQRAHNDARCNGRAVFAAPCLKLGAGVNTQPQNHCHGQDQTADHPNIHAFTPIPTEFSLPIFHAGQKNVSRPSPEVLPLCSAGF